MTCLSESDLAVMRLKLEH